MLSGRSIGGVVLAALVVHTAAFAQVTSADVIGRVTDSTGGVLSGVTVTLTNPATGENRVTETNATGDYVFSFVPIGPYSIRIELEGFGTRTATITLASGDRARFDVRLVLGGLQESVTVTGSASVQTDTAAVTTVVPARAVQDLPANGRNFVRLLHMLPGAHEGLPNSLASGTRPDDRRQTSAISVNGAVDNQNNHLIDGVDNNERAIGTIGVKPSLDAIAAVQVQTSLYTAEVGRTSGGVINIVTKSGTNEVRGTAFGFLRHDRFDARPFFSTDKPRLRQHQVGASAGGPVTPNRTFFFADYERVEHVSGVVTIGRVPADAMRRGDFSALPVAIYDPLTTPRSPFRDNRIPVDRFNPIALRYLALYPQPSTSDGVNNFRGERQRTVAGSTADLRIDHRFSPASSMFVRYSWNALDTFTPGSLPLVGEIDPGGTTDQFPGPHTADAHGVHVNLTRATTALAAELKIGYLNTDVESLPLNYGKNLGSAFGLVGANVDERTSALPSMHIGEFTPLGDANYIPLIQSDAAVQVAGAATKSWNAHTFKLGGGLIVRRFTVFQSAIPVGSFLFDSRVTDDGAGAGGHALASFLLGYPSQVTRSHSLVYPRYHTNEPHVYLQDDWRATSWLTLNLGVRYDVFTPFTEERNQIANFDVTAARIVVAGRDGASTSANVRTDYTNIAPRIGAAITLPGELIVRGGVGLTYFPANAQSESYMKNQPFASVFGPVINGATTGGISTLSLADALPMPEPMDHRRPSGSIIGVAEGFRSTRVRQFNMIVEKTLVGSLLAAGYIGSRGSHVAAVVPDINLAPPGPGAVQPRRRFARELPDVTSITMLQSDFTSSYDALQLVFQRRHQAGISFNANYTLAHNVWTQPAPWHVARIERFDADNDIRHRSALTLSYELPFGRSATGRARYILAGWQVNASASWQTGLPFNVTNLTPRSNTGGADRPDLIANPVRESRDLGEWFATEAFAAGPNNAIGDRVVPRNLLHGPPWRTLDLSMFKHMPATGRARLHLRLEAYNVTNTPSFANPNGQLGNPAFGTITSTVGSARQIQIGAKLLF
jgi:hypothetical protein